MSQRETQQEKEERQLALLRANMKENSLMYSDDLTEFIQDELNRQVNNESRKLELEKSKKDLAVNTKLDDIPLFSKKILGYRNFKIIDGELASCGIEARWVPGKNTAVCAKHNLFENKDHIAPVNDCECGLYAMHDPKNLWEAYSNGIVAAVLGWGKTEVHYSGFRSQYSEIVLMSYDPRLGLKRVKEILDITKLYEVDVVDITEFLDKSKEYGDVLPDSVKPEKMESLFGNFKNIYISNYNLVQNSQSYVITKNDYLEFQELRNRYRNQYQITSYPQTYAYPTFQKELPSYYTKEQINSYLAPSYYYNNEQLNSIRSNKRKRDARGRFCK